MTSPTAKSSGALNSGFDILEVVVNNPDGISVTAVAAELGGDKGNIHRVLRSLVDRGYVEQDDHTKLFSASGGLYAMAGTLIRRQTLTAVARPFMRELSDKLHAPIHLAKRIRVGGVYIAREASASGGVTVETEIGMQPVIHASATGKALFALASPAELDQVLAMPLEQFTAKTVVDIEEFRRELLRVHELGYATDEEELNYGVSCVAAPIFGYTGDIIGSIGLSAPVTQVDGGELQVRGIQIAETALRITHQLGGHVPESFNNHLQRRGKVDEPIT